MQQMGYESTKVSTKKPRMWRSRESILIVVLGLLLLFASACSGAMDQQASNGSGNGGGGNETGGANNGTGGANNGTGNGTGNEGGDEGDKDSGSGSDNEDLEPAAEPVELYFYSPSGDYDTAGFMRVYGNAIQEAFPHVTPKYHEADKKLANLITTGEQLDVLYSSIGQTALSVLAYDMQFDISELIVKHNFDLTRLEPTTVQIQQQLADGGMYGLPVSTNSLTMYYNRDLFDQFGVGYPEDGMSWEETYDLTRTMSRTVDGVDYKGLILSIDHTMMLHPLSPVYIDKETNKGLFTTDTFRDALQTITDFYSISGNEVTNSTKDYGSQLKWYQDDKVVAMFLGLSKLGATHFAEHTNLNWDVATYPRYADQPDIGPQSYPNYFYISQVSEHKDIAFEVIAHMTSEEFQLELTRQGEFPILNGTDLMEHYAADLPHMQDKNIKALLPDTFAEPAFKGEFQQIGKVELREAYYNVILGEKDLNTALREANERIDQKIAERLAQ